MSSRRERIANTPIDDRRPNSRKLVGRLGVRHTTGFANRAERLGQARHARRIAAKARAQAKADRIQAAIKRRIAEIQAA